MLNKQKVFYKYWAGKCRCCQDQVEHGYKGIVVVGIDPLVSERVGFGAASRKAGYK